MFVPGVNGSVIPSAPSGSRLKGAYKNSKKRKMPNGGIELALDAASFAPPPVGTVASLLGAGLNAYQGDYTGMLSFENTQPEYFDWQIGPHISGNIAMFSIRGGANGFSNLSNMINVNGNNGCSFTWIIFC